MSGFANLVRCAFVGLVVMPALAQEPISQQPGLQAAAFLRVPLGLASGRDNQVSFGLGVYAIDRCNFSTDLSRSSCRNRTAAGLELRATGDDRLGLWIAGSRTKELFAFARSTPLSGGRNGAPPSQQLSLTGNDWITIGLVGAAVITVAVLTIRVECDDYKIDPNTGQQTDPC